MLFAIHDCGFSARMALEESGARESRLAKITRLIGESSLSIHDMSRVQLSKGLPRFNMPFECGLAFGAMSYGKSRSRNALVLVAKPFQDKKSISDLAGIDPGYHENKPEKVIACVRSFLASKAPKGFRMRGAQNIFLRYKKFERELPRVLKIEHLTRAEITSLAYITDWILYAVQWMEINRPTAKLP
jgi:hypothetical protein